MVWMSQRRLLYVTNASFWNTFWKMCSLWNLFYMLNLSSFKQNGDFEYKMQTQKCWASPISMDILKTFLYVMNILKMSFVRYECLEDVFRTLWMSKRCLLYVMNFLKMSFERYECLEDVFRTLWMSKRCPLYVLNVQKMSFVRYDCLKDVFCAFWMSKRCLLYVMTV